MKRFTALLISLLVILSCTAVFAAGASGDFHNPAEITYTVRKAGVPRDFTRAECCAFMRAIGLSVPDEVDEAQCTMCHAGNFVGTRNYGSWYKNGKVRSCPYDWRCSDYQKERPVTTLFVCEVCGYGYTETAAESYWVCNH